MGSTTVMTSGHAAMQARDHFTGLVVRQLDRGLLVRIALARQFFAMDRHILRRVDANPDLIAFHT